MVEVTGGQNFERRLAEIARALGSGGSVKIGFLSSATYPNGTPVAMVAAIHNWGGKWPFFSKMIEDKHGEWPAAIAGLVRSTGYDVRKVLQLTGEGVAGQLRQQIVDTVTPPNAPSTVARKGFDKPLVDTAHMLNSVDYEVNA